MIIKPPIKTGVRDVNGREIYVGDLLRTWHYVDARTRRNVYMYHVVERFGDTFQAVPAIAYAVDTDGGRFWVQHANVSACEIIDGPCEDVDDGGGFRRLVCWYERKKRKATE